MERLIRTDKNGTKYFENTTCPKCFGRGYIDCYAHVEGGVCFQCNGSGFYLTYRKVMTPEYAAKLEAQRAARQERKEAEFEAAIAERYKELGLTENGHAYAVLNSTFGRKDELKAAGARFNGAWWYFAEPKQGWDTTEVEVASYLDKDFSKNCLRWREECCYEMKQLVKDVLKQRRTEANAAVESAYYGSVGDKVDTLVTLNKIFQFETIDFRGMDCTMYGYKMSDNDGHHFVWVTGKSYVEIAETLLGSESTLHKQPEEIRAMLEGCDFNLRGSVKNFKEREGLKETQLTRCKIQKAA